MKRETKEKIKGALLRFANGVLEAAPIITVTFGLGLVTSTFANTVQNCRDIRKLQNQQEATEKNVKAICNWGDDVAEKHNRFVDETKARFEALEKDNQVLLRKALQETEGKSA